MSKGIDELKDWAMHNVRLISILPSNKNLPVDTKLTDVLEHDVDEKYFLSEEKTSKLILNNDLSGKLNHFGFRELDAVHSTDGVSPTLNTMQGGNRQPKIAIPGNTVKTVGNVNPSGNGMNGNVFSGAGLSPTLTSQDRHGIAIREATKKGYDIATTGDSVNIQYPESETRRGRVGKGLANTLESSGVNQGVVTKVYGSTQKNAAITDGDISPTLTSSMGTGGGHVPMPEFDNLRIRKLLPIETWRLQGFTDEQFYKAKNDGVSNSQLYKQAGNSVTVNVIDAIARKLI